VRSILALFLILSAGCLGFGQQSPTLIDISQTVPAGFPTDGSSVVIGDHNHVPTFFWMAQNQLSTYQVDGNGQFTAVVFPNASALPAALSSLKMSPRSYWADALFFWGLDGSKLTLWTIRDTGGGFVLASPLSLTVPATSRHSWSSECLSSLKGEPHSRGLFPR